MSEFVTTFEVNVCFMPEGGDQGLRLDFRITRNAAVLPDGTGVLGPFTEKLYVKSTTVTFSSSSKYMSTAFVMLSPSDVVQVCEDYAALESFIAAAKERDWETTLAATAIRLKWEELTKQK